MLRTQLAPSGLNLYLQRFLGAALPETPGRKPKVPAWSGGAGIKDSPKDGAGTYLIFSTSSGIVRVMEEGASSKNQKFPHLLHLRSIRCFRYRLPLARPVVIGGHSLTERQGFLIRCQSKEGATGWGEVAPLPGYTREGLSDAEQALRLVSNTMQGRIVALEQILSGEISSGMTAATPSVRFGFETACLDLLSGPGRGFRHLLSQDYTNQILVNGLLHSLVLPSKGNLAEWSRAGMRVVKCKVGRTELERESAWILRLSERLPAGMKMRLDANRGWSLQQAIAFLRGIPSHSIEYVEEPVRDIGELPELAKSTGVPIALDETVQERGADVFELGMTPAAIVLKPGALPGIAATLRLGREAKDRGVEPVVSSLFESGVGILALAQLAACLGGDRVSCGLDTCRMLKEDTFAPHFSPAGWKWDLQEIDKAEFVVREDTIEELTGG